MIMEKFNDCLFQQVAAILILAFVFSASSCTQKSPGLDEGIEAKVDSVMSLMTLEEKIGQMTLYTSDFDQTGPTVREGYQQDIREGRVGAIF